MTKTFTFSFLFAFNCCCVFAQNKYTDSLKHQLAIAKGDTSRALVMAEICYFYRYSSTDSSLFYGEKALELSQKIKFWKGEANALNRLGLTMREKGDFPRSLELQFKSLKIAQENNYLLGLGNANRRTGLVYNDLGDYPKALLYAYEALKYDRLAHNDRGEAIQYMNLGLTYGQMNVFDSSGYYLNKALGRQSIIKDLLTELNNYMGIVEAKKRKFSEALSLYNRGIQIGVPNNDYRSLSNIYSNISAVQKQINQPDSAIFSAQKALTYGLMASNKKSIYTASNLLAELYDPINPKEALHYYKIATAAKDSLFGAGNIQTIQTIVAKEEARQKEIESARAAYQNQLKQYGLVAGLAVFSIIAIILYRNNRQKQKANQVLKTTLSNLKSTQSQLIQSEKMASLGELTAGIAHEIQNPLNFVNNFSDVNKELLIEMQEEMDKGNIADAKEIASDVISNEGKINHHGKRADAIVKGMLQHSRSSTGVKEPTDINALADEYLRLSYHGLRAKDKSFNATLKTDIDETIGIINIIPQDIGRVILNLITNAFYAVNEKDKSGVENYEPTVSVSTKKVADKVLISVKDNGNGIPQKIVDKIFQPFFTTKPTGQGTGLGLSLAYDIVKTHGGELRVETIEGQGSEFVIELPVV